MANIRDLAVGSVLTAPSPATSGTSLVLASGQGADMPTDPPYKLLVYPTGVVPSKSNSEIIKVTARSTDTLTIVRAQGETTAKSIQAGWLVANAIFTEDIFNSSTVTSEVPGGTINGSNTAFTLASTPTTGSVRVFLNGLRQKLTDDFTISGSTITFVTAPPTGSNLLVDYMVGNQLNSVGTNSYIAKEAVTGSVNGSNAVFTTARAYIAGSLQVFVNGLMQSQTQVTETTPASGTFTLDAAPQTGDVIHVAYQYNLNPSSNADTVDGIHASTTPTANQLYPLNSSGKLPADVFGTGATSATVATAEDTTSTSYVALTTAGPAVTVTIGSNGLALVIVSALSGSSTANAQNYMAFDISGASTSSASDSFAGIIRVNDAAITGQDGIMGVFLVTGLTAGLTTFTAKYKVNAGTGRFATRRLSVIPL